MKCMSLVVLGILAVVDGKTRRIPVEGVFLLAMFLAADGVSKGTVEGWRLLSFIPGILMYFFSMLSGEMLGMGDAFIFFALGFCFDPIAVFRILISSFFLNFLFFLYLGLRRRLRKLQPLGGQAFAMVPWIAFAAGLQYVSEIMV